MYYFIVNPSSGCGKGKKIWETVERELQRRSVSYRSYQLHYRGEARTIAAELSRLEHPFTAVLVGGDGTIDEFIDGLTSFSCITLGCIPTGSGNDFVRGLRLQTDALSALNVILAPQKIRQLKVGRVRTPSGSHAFAVSSGIGFDADVCNGAYRSGAKRFLNFFRAGKLVYLTTALGLLLSMKQHRMKITLEDGEELLFNQAFFASAMNLPCEGGGFFFAPDADPEDPCFDFVVAEGLTRTRILFLLPLALRGRHVGHRGIHILRCQKVSIETASPLCVHTDGEILGFCSSLVFEADQKRLPVITE